MNEPKLNYDVTPIPRFSPRVLTLKGLTVAFTTYISVRRDALLRELIELERGLGYGQKGKPTTSRLRELWRGWGGRCPHCGKELG